MTVIVTGWRTIVKFSEMAGIFSVPLRQGWFWGRLVILRDPASHNLMHQRSHPPTYCSKVKAMRGYDQGLPRYNAVSIAG